MGPPRLARDYVSSASQNFSVRVSLAGIEPVGFRVKSDSRNHQAIVQPRLYDSLMVTRITLKTEGPHGLPSDRLPAEVDPPGPLPLARSCFILADYEAVNAYHLRELSRARTQRLVSGQDHFSGMSRGITFPECPVGQGLRIKCQIP